MAQCHGFALVVVGSFGLLIGSRGRSKGTAGAWQPASGRRTELSPACLEQLPEFYSSLQEGVWKDREEGCVNVCVDGSQKLLPGWQGSMGGPKSETVLWDSKLRSKVWLLRSDCLKEGPCSKSLDGKEK